MESSSPSFPLPPVMLTVGVVSTTSGGPAIVADGLLLSWTGFSSLLQIAPVVEQARLPGSVIVTASLPSGSTVIVHRSLRPSTRWARVTSPLVTVNESSRSTA